jgi:hypothetical protein
VSAVHFLTLCFMMMTEPPRLQESRTQNIVPTRVRNRLQSPAVPLTKIAPGDLLCLAFHIAVKLTRHSSQCPKAVLGSSGNRHWLRMSPQHDVGVYIFGLWSILTRRRNHGAAMLLLLRTELVMG